jgi:hypothetical protein
MLTTQQLIHAQNTALQNTAIAQYMQAYNNYYNYAIAFTTDEDNFSILHIKQLNAICMQHLANCNNTTIANVKAFVKYATKTLNLTCKYKYCFFVLANLVVIK